VALLIATAFAVLLMVMTVFILISRFANKLNVGCNIYAWLQKVNNYSIGEVVIIRRLALNFESSPQISPPVAGTLEIQQ
jgi:hypothetical protein